MPTAGLFDLYYSKNERINNNVWSEISGLLQNVSERQGCCATQFLIRGILKDCSYREFFLRSVRLGCEPLITINRGTFALQMESGRRRCRVI